MYKSSWKQYTRKPRASHVLIALLVAAGGLQAHSAVAPAPPATASDIDPYPRDPWLDDVEFFLDVLWQILIRFPPPKLEDPADNLSEFVMAYNADGIHQNLTQEEREYYSAVVIDFIGHLEMHPDYFDQDLYSDTMEALADILNDLGVVSGD